MEQRGIMTERGNINRAIEISNRKLRKIGEQINELQGWLAEEMAKPEERIAPIEISPQLQPIPQIAPSAEPKASQPTQPQQQPLSSAPKPQPTAPKPPTFAKIILDILTRQAQGKPISNDDMKLHTFLVHNGINDYDGLEQHMKNLMSEQRTLSHEYSPIRSRIAELDEHMRQYENYKKRRADYQQYKKDLSAQMPWKKKAFINDNAWIVDRYNEAKSYMDGVKNANGKIPLPSWQKEHGELSAKVRELDSKFQTLKTKVTQVDKFRVRVYDVLRREHQQHQQKTQPTKRRAQDFDI